MMDLAKERKHVQLFSFQLLSKLDYISVRFAQNVHMALLWRNEAH